MYPESHSCHTCVCQAGFDNKTIVGNPHCTKVDCNVEFNYGDRIARGCIPVYYKDSTCCPISWRCRKYPKWIYAEWGCWPPHHFLSTFLAAESSDAVTTRLRSKEESSDPQLTCKFGKLSLEIGDELNSQEDNVSCTCEVPPQPHCIQKPISFTWNIRKMLINIYIWRENTFEWGLLIEITACIINHWCEESMAMHIDDSNISSWKITLLIARRSNRSWNSQTNAASIHTLCSTEQSAWCFAQIPLHLRYSDRTVRIPKTTSERQRESWIESHDRDSDAFATHFRTWFAACSVSHHSKLHALVVCGSTSPSECFALRTLFGFIVSLRRSTTSWHRNWWRHGHEWNGNTPDNTRRGEKACTRSTPSTSTLSTWRFGTSEKHKIGISSNALAQLTSNNWKVNTQRRARFGIHRTKKHVAFARLTHELNRHRFLGDFPDARTVQLHLFSIFRFVVVLRWRPKVLWFFNRCAFWRSGWVRGDKVIVIKLSKLPYIFAVGLCNTNKLLLTKANNRAKKKKKNKRTDKAEERTRGFHRLVASFPVGQLKQRTSALKI